jgi:NADH-quinone oxidoreductase subunit M
MNSILLSLLIFFPLLSGAVLLLLPRRFGAQVRMAAVGIAALEAVLSLVLFCQFQAQPSLQFTEQRPWIPSLGIEYHLGVDGLSLMLIVLTTLFTVIAMLASWNQVEHRPGSYFSLILLFEAGLIGTALAVDLVLFYLFWELMLIPVFFLIGIWGGAKRIQAVTKFVIYTMAGSLVLLLSILYLGVQYHQKTGAWTFNLLDLYQVPMGLHWSAELLFFGFALAFLIKIPIFPLHTWLPDAYAEAPTPITFLLSGIMAKMGIYGLLRISLPLFPEVVAKWAPILSIVAIIGLVYAAVTALAQTDIKRLIAYSSISHLGLIALGVFTWNLSSLNGTLYHIVNHAVATGALFLLVHLLETRTGTRDIRELGGLATSAPIFAVIFMLMTFASIGVPGLNGFVGEFLILLGVTTHQPILGAMAATTLIFSAAYMLWLTQRFLFGPQTELVKTHENLELAPRQVLLLTPFILAVIVMGIYTAPVIDRIEPTVKQYLHSQNIQLHVALPGEALYE